MKINKRNKYLVTTTDGKVVGKFRLKAAARNFIKSNNHNYLLKLEIKENEII